MCQGQKDYGKSLYFALNFAVNLKLVNKNKVFKRKKKKN